MKNFTSIFGFLTCSYLFIFNKVACIIVAVTMLFLTPYLFYVPKTLLSAIIISSVVGLVNFNEWPSYFKTKKDDFFSIVVTFLFILVFGVEIGLAVGMLFTLSLFFRILMLPNVSSSFEIVSNWSTNQAALRVLDNHQLDDQFIIFTLEESLIFLNAEYVKDFIIDEFQKVAAASNTQLKYLFLEMHHCSRADVLGMESLKQLTQFFTQRQKISFFFIGMKKKVRAVWDSVNDVLHQDDKNQFVNEIHFFNHMDEAWLYLMEKNERSKQV